MSEFAEVRRSITVPVPALQAFETFTSGMRTWWPSANTFGKANYESVHVDEREGGRWYERDHDGNETLWGNVLAWEPPRRVVLTWQINPQGQPEPDASKASVVEIRFTPEGNASTRVDLEHRNFQNHGEEGGAIWSAAMNSEEGGWPYFLGLYQAACASES